MFVRYLSSTVTYKIKCDRRCTLLVCDNFLRSNTLNVYFRPSCSKALLVTFCFSQMCELVSSDFFNLSDGASVLVGVELNTLI